MVIVQHFPGSVKQYVETVPFPGQSFTIPDSCPHSDCQATDCLIRWGTYEALHQRIAVRYHLRPFDLEETAAYIKHLLRVADAQTQIFSDGFVSGVHNHTKGVARKINNVCRNALLLGATEHKQILDETDLKRVLLDLEGHIG